MNTKTLTRTALAALAMTAAFTASAMAPAGEADLFVDQQGHLLSGATDTGTAPTAARDEVRQELAEMRTAGALTQPGEMAEPPSVLMARTLMNEEQAESIRASDLQEQARLAAAEPEIVTVMVMTPVLVIVDPE